MHVIVSFLLRLCLFEYSDMMRKWNGKEYFNWEVHDIIYA